MLSVIMLCFIMLSVIMLSVIMLSVVMLNVVILSVIMLNVVPPFDLRRKGKKDMIERLVNFLEVTEAPLSMVAGLEMTFEEKRFVC
jgi:hypothetical protein